MNSIFAHITPKQLPFGNELDTNRFTFSKIPDYAYISFAQCERYLHVKPIIVSDEYINDVMRDEVTDFYELCKAKFPSHCKDAFWLTTLLRLLVVCNYCDKNNIDKFIHLEYDNLIYSNLTVLDNLSPSLYFTRVGPDVSSAGFTYCNSINNFKKFINRITQIIDKGENIARYFTPHYHISEMVMIDMIYNHTKGIINYLPILPEGIGDDNFNSLGVLFDGASYGQFIGGTNDGYTSGWHAPHHYTGQAIHHGVVQVFFDEYNKKPFVLHSGKRVYIMNLHIHSKQLHNFV